MLANISLQFPEEKILAKLGHVLYKLNIFGYSFIYVPADCMELTMRSQRRNICYFIQILGVKPFPDVILIPTIVNSCMTHLIPKTRMLPICPQIQFCLPKWHYRHLLLAISVRYGGAHPSATLLLRMMWNLLFVEFNGTHIKCIGVHIFLCQLERSICWINLMEHSLVIF